MQPVEESKSESPKFVGYSKTWLKNNAGRWHENTYTRYEVICRKQIWVDNELKNKRLDEVTSQVIKRFLLRLFQDYSSATVELAHGIFHGVFDEAIDDKLVNANPASGILKKILPANRHRDEKEPDPFTREERDKFLECATKKRSWSELLILKMMTYVGLRLGEALAMRLRHLDFNSMSYHVSESFKRHKFGKPKGGKKRLVDLPDFLAAELKEYVLQLKKNSLKDGKGGEVDLLFLDPKEHGKWPYSQNKTRSLAKKVCTDAGLRVRNPHDLRHTYATILIMAHQSPAYVQRQLGHSSISITVDTYGHWIPGEGRQGLENALLGPVRNPDEKSIFLHMQQSDPDN